MRKLIPLLMVALPLMLLLAVGCGDDTTTTITEYDTVTVTDTLTETDTLIEPVPITAKGRMYLAPIGGLRTSGPHATAATDEPTGNAYPDLSVDIYGNGPLEPVLDSALVDDSACELDASYYWTYGDPYNYVTYQDETENMRYGSGDTATIEFFAYNTISTAQVKLLDFVEDAPVLVEAVIPDTVALGEDVTVVWNSVPNADWYGLQVQYRHGGTGTVMTHYTYTYAFDTTLTIPGDVILYDGYTRVYIVASTGPVRDAAEGNIIGDAVVGSIYSYTVSVQSLTYVGTGVPAVPPPSKGLPLVVEETVDDTPVDGWDIIQAITER